MYKKDLIESDIEKFAEMMAKLIGMKSNGEPILFENQLQIAIKDCVGTSIEDLLEINSVELLNTLLIAHSFSVEKIDYLAELLYFYASGCRANGDDVLAIKTIEKMELLWNYATQHQKTISFDRIIKHKKRKQEFLTIPQNLEP